MTFDPLGLPWLPGAPEHFRELCRKLGPSASNLGREVQRLAGSRLDATQSAILARTLKRLRTEGADLSPLSPFKLAIVSNATFDFVSDCLPAAAARHGVNLQLFPTDFGQVEQEILDPSSSLRQGEPEAVLLALDHRWYGLDRPMLAGDPEARVREALERVRRLISNCVSFGAIPIVPNLATPPLQLFGSFDRRVAGTIRSMIDRVNEGLLSILDEEPAVLFDVGAIAESVGTTRWFDVVYYNLYKLPFTPDGVALYCDMLGRLLGALRGKARKCLVLDLDNTCWGGAIGDDGLEGIQLGAGSPQGESFQSVQQMAMDLKARGVILAVSSKNHDETARQPFREHPDMVLKEDDIAVFQANWEDKPSNIEAIAKILSIGLDALVFLDDNASEREQVRRAIPEVATPELPADPAFYPLMLVSAGYFEAIGFSEEDRQRAASYRANAQRAEVLGRARDLGDYLSSLEMRISHGQFNPMNRARVAQLINKSNQFNLTTRRYTESQVAQLETDESSFTLQTRLADKFGDFGLIGVVISREFHLNDRCGWDIDTWLMSCRVLGRQVERAMLGEVVAAARARGVELITARYIPTAKNDMVRDHYDKLGFTRESESSDGHRRYVLDVATYEASPLPFAGAQ